MEWILLSRRREVLLILYLDGLLIGLKKGIIEWDLEIWEDSANPRLSRGRGRLRLRGELA